MAFAEQLNNKTSIPDFPTYFPEPLPDWLEDEGLLRDEAAVLGLSDARLEEKTALISLYFQQHTVYFQRELENQAEKIGELNLLIEQKSSRTAELQRKTADLEAATPDGEPQFLKNTVGLIACFSLLIGTYYLLDEMLQPHFRESRLITSGIMLAGFFGHFYRSGKVTETHSSFLFQCLRSETALPIATSFFVFVQTIQNQSPFKSIALSLFIFVLFVVIGHSISGLVTALQDDFRYWNQRKKLKKERETKTQMWGNEVNQLTISIDAIRVQKWQLLPALHRVEGELARINTRRALLIHLFETEFKLARSLRDQLSERQRRAIMAD
ncbi:hypothetical protein [Larkinella rosea]|uniref:Uncharacterized protein n=1 Tax=Larkinella rosea TaxID=2025312 RepID=A0A3P1BIL6_9BACT|nr:hypothetical protein [Larkinella rosea]RRB00812.1 hypothetical protein EHT25_21705 [Larkinella rosea]